MGILFELYDTNIVSDDGTVIADCAIPNLDLSSIDFSAMKGGSGSGNFQHHGRPGQVGGSADDKSTRAKQSYTPITRTMRQQAAESEVIVADLVGGALSGDNSAFDVTTLTHGIEVKTIFPGKKNPYITMHPDSRRRKIATAMKEKLKTATIVIDTRETPRQFYFREGVGNFSLSTMTKVKPSQLKEML